jgi:hypothetical protein
MAQTNSSILRGFLDEVINQRRPDLLPKYFSEEYVGHGTPYVGLGIAPDYSDGVKVTVRLVNPGGPAEGKLMAGDEILRVSDGERTWETFEELRRHAWGQGVLGTSLTMWVRREGAEHKISLVRGLVPSFEFPYQLLESGMREWLKDWPDLEIHLVNAIEAGDLVAYHAENQGHNARYGRSAVWSEFGFVRVQDGKITDWWSAEDTFSLFKQLGYTIEEPAVVKA